MMLLSDIVAQYIMTFLTSPVGLPHKGLIASHPLKACLCVEKAGGGGGVPPKSLALNLNYYVILIDVSSTKLTPSLGGGGGAGVGRTPATQ
jgi:hypothetical protein